jgi:hypothetical protein
LYGLIVLILVPEHPNWRLIVHTAGLGAKPAELLFSDVSYFTLGGFLFGTKTGFLR